MDKKTNRCSVQLTCVGARGGGKARARCGDIGVAADGPPGTREITGGLHAARVGEVPDEAALAGQVGEPRAPGDSHGCRWLVGWLLNVAATCLCISGTICWLVS